MCTGVAGSADAPVVLARCRANPRVGRLRRSLEPGQQERESGMARILRTRTGGARPGRIARALLGAALLTIPARADAQWSVGQASLASRMEAFRSAVRSGDPTAVERFFPRNGEWTWRRTTHATAGDRVGVWRFRPGELRRAIERGPLSPSFRLSYHGQPIGTLVHQVTIRPGAWTQLPGLRFVPPGAGQESDIYVSWRQEAGEWVISTVADEIYAGRTLPAWCCRSPAR